MKLKNYKNLYELSSCEWFLIAWGFPLCARMTCARLHTQYSHTHYSVVLVRPCISVLVTQLSNFSFSYSNITKT